MCITVRNHKVRKVTEDWGRSMERTQTYMG